MSDRSPRPEHWGDELLEKHECGPYRDPISIPFHHAGRPMNLLAPWGWHGPTEMLETTTSATSELLYRVAKEWSEEACLGFTPILIVAHRRNVNE